MRGSKARVWLAALFSLITVGALAAPVSAEADDGPEPSAETGRYVVILEDEPLVTQFGIDGVNSPAARAKGRQMKADQAAVATSAGIDAAAISVGYTGALNGFAVDLTESQVDKIKSTDGVLMVLEDYLRQPQTDSSIEFLGLTGGGGAHTRGLKGDGVIVGIIDTGIWPENPSFADDGSYPDPGIVLDESEYPACDFGNTAHNADDVPFECNNKLIGARQVLPTYRSIIGAEPFEFDSARDDNGHGSHTAGTAAGNAGVEAEMFGNKLGVISGVAPRAHIIAYKGLGDLGGFTSDLAASIDQAVFDGVDVINYSIGGGAGTPGADEFAFLWAAEAGVHVATSAGNSGPGAATLGNPATVPWLTSVGASTQDRFFAGTATLGDGRSYIGASITNETEMLPLVDAEFAGGDLCIPGTLDPTVVEGKIVLCRRGAIARVGKSTAVLEAGGVGMIMYNNSDVDNLYTDNHLVPSVHIDNTPGLEIKAYIGASDNPMAQIASTAEVTTWDSAPSMTIFSSRGPNPVAGDIIKPDVTAPGFQILAAYSPATAPHQDFGAIAGTSMSSPHVAGLMALMDEAHPDWSAAAVKSALMTTAHQDVRNNDRVSPAGPFEMGAGHVDVGKPGKKGSAFQPGLVYEAGVLDYFGFLCDAFPQVLVDPVRLCGALEAGGVPTEAVNLNYPSIGVSELAGSVTVTRTVTGTKGPGEGWRTWNVSVDAPEGFEVSVTPDNIRMKAGQSVTYQVTITNVSAPIGEWRHGSLTWATGDGFEARSPISVKGLKFAAPAEVSGSGEAGSVTIPVRLGYTGEYSAAAHGLEPATVFSGNVLQDPDQVFDPADGYSNLHQVTTSGASSLLIKMPPDATEAQADIDIFVFDSNGLVATSTAGGTDEEIVLNLPADDTYDIWVHGWSAPGGDSDYDLYTWVVPGTSGGSLSVSGAPASVTVGDQIDLDVSWTGATAGEWHYGAVSHSDATGIMGVTLVEVDNRVAGAAAAPARRAGQAR